MEGGTPTLTLFATQCKCTQLTEALSLVDTPDGSDHEMITCALLH